MTQATDPPDILWSPAGLNGRLAEPNLRIIDVRRGEAFAMGHIPGARHFDVMGLNCDDTNDAPLGSFVRMFVFLLGMRGVTLDDTVVFYGDDSDATAARALWFADYLGLANAHILDGGYKAWEAAGLPTTRDAEVPKGAVLKPATARNRLATYQDVLAATKDKGRVILDTRSLKEWLGTDVRADRGGAIPGAVHLEWTEHLTADKTFKTAAELKALFEGRGITADQEVIPYCQTGYRAAHAYVALRIAGYPKVRNYLGSWKEWANNPDLPVVVPEA